MLEKVKEKQAEKRVVIKMDKKDETVQGQLPVFNLFMSSIMEPLRPYLHHGGMERWREGLGCPRAGRAALRNFLTAQAKGNPDLYSNIE